MMLPLEVNLDGDQLELAQNSRLETVMCMVVCGLTRLGGIALLLLGVWLAMAHQDYVGALNVMTFGMVMLLSGLLGLREFQNAPRRITLDTDALHFYDAWTGKHRDFQRTDCATAQYSPENAAIYITHPNKQIDLLAEDIPEDAAPGIVDAINRHLCP